MKHESFEEVQVVLKRKRNRSNDIFARWNFNPAQTPWLVEHVREYIRELEEADAKYGIDKEGEKKEEL